MICPKCKKQIADTSTMCPHCSLQIDHRSQVPKEISLRRYQRWFFYGLISILIIGMVATIAKIYNVNTTLVTNMAMADSALKERAAEIASTREELAGQIGKLDEVSQSLTVAQKEIATKTDSYKEILFEKTNLEEKYNNERNAKDEILKNVENCEEKLDQTDAMVYAMIVSLGVGIGNDNLQKIPLAEANFTGQDTDGDGLSDLLENALKTDPTKIDSDGDTYSDKQEALNGFNPTGLGNLPIDINFANAQKGKILLQVEGDGEAWYVNPDDGKRYFLGRPAEALALLASL